MLSINSSTAMVGYWSLRHWWCSWQNRVWVICCWHKAPGSGGLYGWSFVLKNSFFFWFAFTGFSSSKRKESWSVFWVLNCHVTRVPSGTIRSPRLAIFSWLRPVCAGYCRTEKPDKLGFGIMCNMCGSLATEPETILNGRSFCTFLNRKENSH